MSLPYCLGRNGRYCMYYTDPRCYMYCAGVLQADPGLIREHDHIFRLYCHECQRVFHDRLVDSHDKTYFNTMLSEMASKHFSKVCSVAQDCFILLTTHCFIWEKNWRNLQIFWCSIFEIFYWLYTYLHNILVGVVIIWNHYTLSSTV